jgi:hypothetical protein
MGGASLQEVQPAGVIANTKAWRLLLCFDDYTLWWKARHAGNAEPPRDRKAGGEGKMTMMLQLTGDFFWS